MTFVEFFDGDPLNNIISCLAVKPERVILIGSKDKIMKKQAEKYREFFMNRWTDIDFICVKVNKNDLEDNVRKISDIVQTYNDCVFDITGGEEVSLLALGTVYERFRDKVNIQIHRFNVNNNSVHDCDNDGTVIGMADIPDLKIEEMISLRGGKIIYEADDPFGTTEWEIDEEFCEDIALMWDICRQNVRFWNTQINILNTVEMHRDQTQDQLLTVAPTVYVNEYLKKQGYDFMLNFTLIKSLNRIGVIEGFNVDASHITIKYKNEQIKKCLTKAGLVLEMIVYVTALNLKDDKGNRIYSDVMNGAYIDWDGKTDSQENGIDTRNEIDVILMKGIIPVFISCKNGVVDNNELYKFNSVSEHFGGKNVRKVLIANALGDDVRSEYIRRRAKDMRIRIIDDLYELSGAEFEKIIKNLVNN